MDAHATGKVTMELVVLCFRARDFDAERGIRECFFHDADEFDNVFSHRVETEESNLKKPGYPS